MKKYYVGVIITMIVGCASYNNQIIKSFVIQITQQKYNLILLNYMFMNK